MTKIREEYAPRSRSQAPRRPERSAAPRAQQGGRRPAPSRQGVKRPAGQTRRPPRAKYGKRRRRTSPMKALIIWICAVALAFGIALALRSNVFELVRVSGDGMYETLMDGDLAVVSKLSYKSEEPRRDDIVAVRVSGGKGLLMRRIVGMPGDTVEVVSGETFLSGEKKLEPYVVLQNYESFPAKTLSAGRYYLLGDNRTETYDSRSEEIGLVGKEDIVGKAVYVLWPVNHWRGL